MVVAGVVLALAPGAGAVNLHGKCGVGFALGVEFQIGCPCHLVFSACEDPGK